MVTVNKSLPTMQRSTLVPSVARSGEVSTEVQIVGPVDVYFDDNIEQDFSDGNISAVKAVYKTINGVSLGEFNGSFDMASVVGITRTSANDGSKIKYKIIGKFDDSSLNFPINDSIYLGVSGVLTNIPPVTGHRVKVGTSNGSGSIQINIEEPVIL